MTRVNAYNRLKYIGIPLVVCVVVLLYAAWWGICIYVPYAKKRNALEPDIAALEEDIRQRREQVQHHRMIQERFSASMAPLEPFRSNLPLVRDLPEFVRHVKQRARRYNLTVEEVLTSPSLSADYPAEALIAPVHLSFTLKGEFVSVGKFLQYMDEEERHFCHVRSVTLERSLARGYSVLARVKTELFCRKEKSDESP
ncbi:MAG: type 4a pilus biogenesis protein PilO [bacterium]